MHILRVDTAVELRKRLAIMKAWSSGCECLKLGRFEQRYHVRHLEFLAARILDFAAVTSHCLPFDRLVVVEGKNENFLQVFKRG